MPPKLDLPNISLPVPVLPCIKLSNDNDENDEFSFNQPLTIEQFGLQIAEKSCKKQHKVTSKKTPNSNTKSIKKGHHLNSTVLSTSINDSTPETSKKTIEKESIVKNDTNVENVNKNDKLSQFGDNSKYSFNKSVPCFEFKLDSPKSNSVVFDNTQVHDSNEKLEKLSVKIQKSWTCDGCWVPNNSDKTNCVACQTPRPSESQQPLKVAESSTWTCETCWVPNKNEIDSCVACQTQKPGTVKKVEQISTWKCDACWVMNKNECTSCISCGTPKPGLVQKSKSQPSLEFKFGLNNNFFDKSVGSQFKFGFDSSKTDQSTNQYQFGSIINPEKSKSDLCANEFKFGMINNKADEPLATFKCAVDKPSASQPVKNASDISSSNNTDVPSNQFKFGNFDTKMDQAESQFKFGNVTNSAPVTCFKFGSDLVETEKSVQQNFVTDTNKVTQSTNELQFVNNKNELSEKSIDLQNKSKELKFGETKQTEKSTSQVTFGSIETNCINSNSLINIGHKNDDLSKVNFAWDKKDKIETKSINFGTSQTVQPAIENTNTTQLVNGHSHSNEILNVQPKPGLIKTSQLFSFGSLAKQDQHFSDDQKKPMIFNFGSTTNDNKSFVTPLLSTSSFPSTVPVFGATNSIFGSGHTTSTPGTLGSSVPAPKFSFGSMAPPTSNSFFSKTTTKNEKSFLQTSNSFASGTNVGFSLGAPSASVFSVANAGGFMKSSVEVKTLKYIFYINFIIIIYY